MRLPWLCSLIADRRCTPRLDQRSAIEGVVTDPQGALVRDVTVALSGDRLIGGRRTATTDATGHFRFVELLPGTYDVEASAPGIQDCPPVAHHPPGRDHLHGARRTAGGRRGGIRRGAGDPGAHRRAERRQPHALRRTDAARRADRPDPRRRTWTHAGRDDAHTALWCPGPGCVRRTSDERQRNHRRWREHQRGLARLPGHGHALQLVRAGAGICARRACGVRHLYRSAGQRRAPVWKQSRIRHGRVPHETAQLDCEQHGWRARPISRSSSLRPRC